MAVVCTSMAALRSAIMKEMRDAMAETQYMAQDDMEMAIETVFYEGGSPKVYERTGQLGNTPQISPLSQRGLTITFDAKLNNSGSYTSGKNPSMQDILALTNYGTTNSSVGRLAPAVGGKRYWEKAEEQIEKSLNDNMKNHF